MVRVLVGMGITKVRLTGGEPLLRNGVVDFVRELEKLRPQGLKPLSFSGRDSAAGSRALSKQSLESVEQLDIALTTNGHLLAEMAQPLKGAGLTRATVSMDAVDPERFARITRVANGYDHVLAGIRAARSAALWPGKVHCVQLRGSNEDHVVPYGTFARAEGVTGRVTEFMPLEEARAWSPKTVVPLDETLTAIAAYHPLV